MKINDYNKLVAEVLIAKTKYDSGNDSMMTDSEYDSKFKRLIEVESLMSDGDINPASPTRIIGTMTGDVELTTPMLSLDNAFNKEDLEKFLSKVRKTVDEPVVEFSLETKYDGIACELIYKSGDLVSGTTRGDGVMGKDITQAVKHAEDIPQSIQVDSTLVIRGELMLTRSNFEIANEDRISRGEKPYVNCRNAAAGIATSKVNSWEKYPLTFRPYSVGEESYTPETVTKGLAYLSKLGFTVTKPTVASDISGIIDYIDDTITSRDVLPYDIDGVVVKVNHHTTQIELGNGKRSPRWAMAYKFPAQEAKTILIGAKFQVSKIGTITPVALLQPVLVGGVQVSNANLVNADMLTALGLRVGQTVIVRRAGDVIPQIVGAIPTDIETPEIEMPKECPVCMLDVDVVGSKTICSQGRECPGASVQQLCHFVSRSAMNIQGVGINLLSVLINRGVVSTPSDLYRLSPSDLDNIIGVGDHTIRKTINSIERSKTTTLSRCIYALAIPNVGLETARELGMHYDYLETLIEDAKLGKLKGVTGKAEASVKDYVNKYADTLLSELVKYLTFTKATKVSDVLAGNRIALTGTFLDYSRDQLMAMVVSHGGTCTESVSSTTDYILVGDAPGGKYRRALELNVPIIAEDDLEDFFTEEQ